MSCKNACKLQSRQEKQRKESAVHRNRDWPIRSSAGKEFLASTGRRRRARRLRGIQNRARRQCRARKRATRSRGKRKEREKTQAPTHRREERRRRREEAGLPESFRARRIVTEKICAKGALHGAQLRLAYQFPAQINDLADVMVGVGGAIQHDGETIFLLAALGGIGRVPIGLGLFAN